MFCHVAQFVYIFLVFFFLKNMFSMIPCVAGLGSRHWSTVPVEEGPILFDGYSCTAVGSKIVIFGGRKPDQSLSNTTYIFDVGKENLFSCLEDFVLFSCFSKNDPFAFYSSIYFIFFNLFIYFLRIRLRPALHLCVSFFCFWHRHQFMGTD